MIPNLIGSEWRVPSNGAASLPVYNPATGQVIEQVPMSGSQEVDAAVQAAVTAYRSWSRTAVMERVRLMFRFKALLEDHFEDLAAIITRHHGKTLEESRGAERRPFCRAGRCATSRPASTRTSIATRSAFAPASRPSTSRS